jgi:short-subunit dehydrogenase
MKYFYQKNVYITGGSSGIGLEVALILASYDANVAIFGRDKEKLEDARAKIEAKKIDKEQKIFAFSMDIANHNDVADKIQNAVKAFGIPDIVINSAGMGHSDYFENVSYDTFNKVILTNLYGTRNVISAVLPRMKKNGGHIVNVSSMIGLIGLFGYSTYGASKFALVGFSECLRSELKQYNIYVSVFCPPEVDTPMTDLMLKTSPPETRALVRMTGFMTPQRVAGILLDGIRKKRFLIIAGFLSKWTYLNKRYFPLLVQGVMDMVVKRTAKGKKT